MRIPLGIIMLALVDCVGCSESNTKIDSGDIIYFKKFDIFHLRGTGQMQGSGSGERVSVKYSDKTPVSIKFNLAKRPVTLILEDSFRIKGKPVLVYSTSNFNGGKPGKHRVYAGHTEEHKFLVYVSFSDTLLVEMKDVPATSNFFFDLYVKRNDAVISMTSGGEYDYDGKIATLARPDLFSKWSTLLKYKYATDSVSRTTVNTLPRE